MAAADTSTKSRRNTVIQARQTCEEIIGSVKTIQNGDADLTAEFLGDFRDKACRFLAAIEQINLPICDRLEYFRDFVVADDPSIHPFTPLGLPYSQDDCGAPDLALSLTRQWLQHMSHTRDQLDELARNAPAEAKRNPNGGRKKSPKTKKLWERLAHQFGPRRKATGAFPEVHPANAFIGNYLRFELLSRYGMPGQIRRELADYYLYMADRTGTLWENVGSEASCNHGFASHVAHSLYRDLLGVRHLDTQNKTVRLKIADVGLDCCEGRLLTPDGPVVVRWWNDNGQTRRHIEIPAGYVLVDSDKGR